MADAVVKLDVRAPGYWYQEPNSNPGNGDAPQGWTKSSTHPEFIYKYSGGNTLNGDGSPKDDGSWNFTADSTNTTKKVIEVQLATMAGGAYTLADIAISYDGGATPPPADQLSHKKIDDRTHQIEDPDLHAESGAFDATVDYKPDNGPAVVGIKCDPQWKNQ